MAFAQTLIDEGHRNGQLRGKIDTYPFRTELGDEISIYIENELLPHVMTRIAISR
jgi:hypothetical protein